MTSTCNQAPWANVVPTGPMLPPSKAAQFLGLSRFSFYEQVARGVLPRPIKVGVRSVALPQSWLNAVILDRVGQGDAK